MSESSPTYETTILQRNPGNHLNSFTKPQKTSRNPCIQSKSNLRLLRLLNCSYSLAGYWNHGMAALPYHGQYVFPLSSFSDEYLLMKRPMIHSQEWRLNRRDTRDPNNQHPRCIHICILYLDIYNHHRHIYTYIYIHQSVPIWTWRILYSMDMMTLHKELMTSWGDASILLKTQGISSRKPKTIHFGFDLFQHAKYFADHFYINLPLYQLIAIKWLIKVESIIHPI